MKKMIALFAALMLLASCAIASAETTGTLVWATNPEYPPFEFIENEKVVGYDADLIDAIAAKIGMEAVPESMAFDAIVSSVQTNPNMIAISGISITDERKLTVNFTDGYIDAGLVVITKADAAYSTVDDLKGKAIGVQLGTTSDFKAEEITGAENVATYSSFINATLDLQGNKLDAVIVDGPVGQAILASLNDPTLVVANIDLGAADWYGIAVNKSNPELLDKINGALKELKEEGFLEELAAKYFSSSEEAAQ
ncbi:MAG: transporter substrate-binding domain-containing protein [Clostridia bacterium]|nr:transporter substrate-binding domain-containing protein [Clostridia bacterium]